MMDFTNRICQTLHQEHLANIALLSRVARLIAVQRASPPDITDPSVRQLLSELATGAATEVQRHFDFEERGLFVYLDTIGESAIGTHLTAEHTVLRPLISRLAAMAHDGMGSGFDETTWNEFRRRGGEACELMPAHIQREEMALLPLIEDSMDAEAEARLCQDYLENV
jgi:hemerythrin-like domain-containing protein